jgi:hypothetical protein
MAEGLLDRLEGVLDEFAGLDPDTLDDSELDELVVALGRHDTRLEAAWCRLIGRWDSRQIWAVDGLEGGRCPVGQGNPPASWRC